MSVLAVVGQHLVGNLSVVPEGATPSREAMELLADVLKHGGSSEFVAKLISEHATRSGVSGGYLKVLAETVSTRRQLPLDRWIVKLPSASHPWLSANEYFSMRAAQLSGITTPHIELSDDGQVLLSERFDVREDGSRFAFEDMCSLMGLPSGLKFSGSVERIIKTIDAYCAGDQRRQSLEQFFRQYALAMILRNGDAHLKNFGLLSDNGRSPSLSPCYDMVTMAAYAPLQNNGQTMDIPALMFGGTKSWIKLKDIVRLAKMCGADAKAVLYDIESGINRAASDMSEYAKSNPAFREHAQKILMLWKDGMGKAGLSPTFDLAALEQAMCAKPS
jgi:serine/threonine-protein kinase HipA